MATTEIVIKAFVSSPNDVTEERKILEDIVRELNNTWSKFLGLRLDLIKWETHCFPGIGNYSQEVINKEIGDDYDIFIGIMWQHFGTPTALYGSGTIEEFERAYERYKKNPAEIKIMFYFKDTPPDSLSSIDPEQISAIAKFKTLLGEKGTLYWIFKDREEFSSLLRMHLNRQIQSFLQHIKIESQFLKKEVHSKEGDVSQVVDDEEGFLDIFDLYETSINKLAEASSILAQMTDDVTCFGTKVTQHTSELAQLSVRNPSSFKTLKQITDASAEDMEELSNKIESYHKVFYDAHKESFDSFSRAITLSVDFIPSRETLQLEGVLASMKSFNQTMFGAKSVIVEYCSIISSLPRMSKNFNRAKKRLVKAFEEVIAKFYDVSSMAEETEKTVNILISRTSNNK